LGPTAGGDGWYRYNPFGYFKPSVIILSFFITKTKYDMSDWVWSAIKITKRSKKLYKNAIKI